MPVSKNRKAALAALRARKSGLAATSRTEEYEVKDEGAVYDVYDEDQYHELVDRRREREDFVVDDDGIGYHDDGEENHFNEEIAKTKRKREAEAHRTAKALKKARQNKALADQGGENDNDPSAASSTKSMWDFIKPGGNSVMMKSTSMSKSSDEKQGLGRRSGSGVQAEQFESLLDGLDGPSTKRRTGGGGSKSRSRGRASGRTYGRARHTSSSRGDRGRRTNRNSSDNHNRPHQQKRRSRESYQDHDADADTDVYQQYGHDDDHDEGIGFELNNDNGNQLEDATNMDLDGSNNNTNVQNEQAHDDDDEHLKNSHQPQLNNLTIEESESQTDIAMINDGEGGDDANSPESVQNKSSKPKFFTKRGKFSDRMSSAAKVALEKKIKPEPIKIKTQERNKPAITATTAPEAMDKNSASFLPTSIASASSSSSSSLASNASKAKFESVIQETKMDDKPRSFIDMYWIDANEVNGVVYLYGKTPKTVGSNDFCSICVVIKGNQHNLFVLPKSGADMMAVHNELKGVLPIPQSKGASWGSKVVKRKYAFGDEAIPREESQYLKVVYDAHHPKPSEEVCSAGGTHFSKILNAGATTLETFILKRKLMGPCWVRIYDAVQTSFPVSWCKIECTIDSPKKLVRCDKAKDDKAMEEINKKLPIRPAPPLTTVTIKIKTVVNPKSNKSEVISVSAICHQNINVDSSTIESRENMSQISLIRPLGQNISIESGGLPQLPRDLDDEIKRYLPGLKKSCNERALLNLLMTQIGNWDPDVLVGHNAWGYDMEVLLTRCIENKVQGWTKIGRRRNVNVPKGNFSGKEWAIADALKGRLLCDTYISAKELLRETTYSLTNLAQSQLKTERVDIEPVDIPQWFNKSSDVVKLALHTLRDAELVQRLMLKLQVLPLTKQLTSIAGNLWCRTMKGHRAERNEYLLLHEFHQLKYIVPEKRKNNTASSGRGKAKYSGGLVLEPKKGLYDTFILLLDFNSLYPSIVQEYNLCFTTMNWSEFVLGGAQNSGNVNVDDGESNPTSGIAEILPPVPADSQDTGVLPRVIKTLVERRRTVKTLMKNENNSDKKEEFNIRQMALKLTANSMYGCLGFSHSRFYAQPIAALITSKGREILQRSVTIAQDTVGLDVIYGDTDSIMINTRIAGNNIDQLKEVHALGAKVKYEVNRLYRTLELEIDGVFRSMLLLKKKKYAAITVDSLPDGKTTFGKEVKGLDLVRRDWCLQSKDSGKFVLDQILSGQDREVSLSNIHSHLEEVAKKMRNNELPLEQYTITKGLSKHPNQYPDAKSQPHVQVAKMMLKAKRSVNTGDHIPYIITQAMDGSESQNKKSGAADRARHPEEIQRSNGILKPDIEWYLSQQILPPISRLCENIDGTSQAMIAEKLGLDFTRFSKIGTGNEIDDNTLVSFVPTSLKKDSERFNDVDKFCVTCKTCQKSNELKGVFLVNGNQTMSGYHCPNAECKKPYNFGHKSHFDLLNVLSNKITVSVRQAISSHGKYEYSCEDPMCGQVTRQFSVKGKCCLRRGCTAAVKPVHSAAALDTHIKYLKSLCDISHCHKQYVMRCNVETEAIPIQEVKKSLSREDQVVAEALCDRLNIILRKSAYNTVEANIFAQLFAI